MEQPWLVVPPAPCLKMAAGATTGTGSGDGAAGTITFETEPLTWPGSG